MSNDALDSLSGAHVVRAAPCCSGGYGKRDTALDVNPFERECQLPHSTMPFFSDAGLRSRSFGQPSAPKCVNPMNTFGVRRDKPA